VEIIWWHETVADFRENVSENICIPESFCEDLRKTGANTLGSLKKLIVLEIFFIIFVKTWIFWDLRENENNWTTGKTKYHQKHDISRK
jgi:hypothetical protein